MFHYYKKAKMARALKLSNRVTTSAMEYRGGKEQKIWLAMVRTHLHFLNGGKQRSGLSAFAPG